MAENRRTPTRRRRPHRPQLRNTQHTSELKRTCKVLRGKKERERECETADRQISVNVAIISLVSKIRHYYIVCSMYILF